MILTWIYEDSTIHSLLIGGFVSIKTFGNSFSASRLHSDLIYILLHVQKHLHIYQHKYKIVSLWYLVSSSVSCSWCQSSRATGESVHAVQHWCHSLSSALEEAVESLSLEERVSPLFSLLLESLVSLRGLDLPTVIVMFPSEKMRDPLGVDSTASMRLCSAVRKSSQPHCTQESNSVWPLSVFLTISFFLLCCRLQSDEDQHGGLWWGHQALHHLSSTSVLS